MLDCAVYSTGYKKSPATGNCLRTDIKTFSLNGLYKSSTTPMTNLKNTMTVN